MAKVAKEQKSPLKGNQAAPTTAFVARSRSSNLFIGDVTELHVWSNRLVWPQYRSPERPDPVPDHLNQILAGPVKHRPYKSGVYHTFKWRGWLDGGTGAPRTWPATPSTCRS